MKFIWESIRMPHILYCYQLLNIASITKSLNLQCISKLQYMFLQQLLSTTMYSTYYFAIQVKGIIFTLHRDSCSTIFSYKMIEAPSTVLDNQRSKAWKYKSPALLSSFIISVRGDCLGINRLNTEEN